jgi:hypothetical protein
VRRTETTQNSDFKRRSRRNPTNADALRRKENVSRADKIPFNTAGCRQIDRVR